MRRDERMEHGVVNLRSSVLVALLLLMGSLMTACGNDLSATGQPSLTAVSQDEAEQLRDSCVAESLRLLRDLADRLAPLARVRDLEHLEATATTMDCIMVTRPSGFDLVCESLGLVLSLEYQLDGTLSLDPGSSDELRMIVSDLDPERNISGELWIHREIERGLILSGGLHRSTESGCEAILEFEDLIGQEFGGLDGLYFTEGRVDLIVLAADAIELARGSAALSGRDAFVVLNFDGISLLDEIFLD
jgi:hypothetical protein